MDGKRRTSLLRKSICGRNENTVPSSTPRLKRRISFSGKHLVREFHREEVPKTWENSYEISDHLNADDVGSKLSMSLNAHQRKENLPLEQTNSGHLHNGNNHSISRDLTNVQDQSNTLCIENSVNVTLFENEKQYFAKNHKVQQSSAEVDKNTNFNSFSLNENELLSLPTLRLNIVGERTIDFMEDARRGTCQLRYNATINKKQISAHEMYNDEKDDRIGVSLDSEFMDEADYTKFICNENTDRMKAITINSSKSLSTSSIEHHHSNRKLNKRETPREHVAMDFDKENVQPFKFADTTVTSNTRCFMNIDKSSDSPNPTANVEKESKEFQKKLDTISFFKTYNDKSDMIFKQHDLNTESKATLRPTINFKQNIESSPLKPETNDLRESINLCDDMICSTNHANILESARKNGQPQKLVVRKTCTSFANKSKNVIDVDVRETDVIPLSNLPTLNSDLIQIEPELDNSLNFSISSAKCISLSPETSSSLLIPLEYKEYNFKQLNDEFECGKIQLFSKTNTAERKPKEYFHTASKITFSELPKQRRTLFFEDDIASDHNATNDYKPSDSNDYFDFNATRGTALQGTKIKCRFSQADDLMLDSTSFLARAKLGDETTSRNSTKRDITQFNDMNIFDETCTNSSNKFNISFLKPMNRNNENVSLHLMFKDAKPDFSHIINSKRENCISLYNNVSSIEEYESGNRFYFQEVGKNLQYRKTILLNEDINPLDIENNKHVTPTDNKHLLTDRNKSKLYNAAKESTTYCHDDMELDEDFSTSIYKNKDIEIDGENIPHILNTKFALVMDNIITNPVPSSLPIHQVQEESTLASIKKLNKKPITPFFLDDHNRHIATSEGLTFRIEEDKNKLQRTTIFFHNKSSKSGEISFENICTECSEIQNYSVKRLGAPNLENTFDNGGSRKYNTKTAAISSLTYRNDSLKNSSHDKICSQIIQGELTTIESENQQWDQEIESDIDGNEMSYSKDPAKSLCRKTIYFNQKIETEDLHRQSTANVSECKGNRHANSNSPITIQDRDMDLEENIHTSHRDDELCTTSELIVMKNEKVCSLTSNKVRITLQCDNGIVEMDECESIRKSNEEEKGNHNCLENEKDCAYLPKKNSTSNTGYFYNEYQMENSNIDVSKSVCAGAVPFKTPKVKPSDNLDEITTTEQKNGTCEAQLRITNTETLEDMESNVANCPYTLTENITDDSIIPPHDNAKDVRIKEHKTKEDSKVYYDTLPVDQSFASADEFCCSKPIPLNSAKLTTARQRQVNIPSLLSTKYKSFLHNDNCLTTPAKGSVNREGVIEMTPRLSLNEFLAFERRMENTSDKGVEMNVCSDGIQYKSPMRNDVSIKRLPKNLTPQLSIAKKRHTLVFTNCDMDESMPSDHDQRDIKIIEMEETKCDDNGTKNKIDTSIAVISDHVLQTPTKQRKSRIPVPLSNGKKNNMSLHPKLNNTKYIDELSRLELINDDGENCTQSIQEIRRAANFQQNEQKSQTLSFLQRTGQRLIVEDNPITISDVSVYFQAHRKSVADTFDMTVTEEMKGKNFQNHYLNLTCGSVLEDIDQTRLCLVGTLSDEDDNDCEAESKRKDNEISCTRLGTDYQNATAACNGNEEKTHSTNRMRNMSTMCRKCKRCQETIFNETTSSMTDSFVLPFLPYVPTLDLDRLRRFRCRRLRIYDANLLWQRASLDRTIINANNVSSDSIKAFSIFKDCRHGDCSVVIKPIRKYLNYIQRFQIGVETHVYKSLSIESSFFSRLGDLFRIHLPNWIFDYQMQYMGVMVFTNKIISTFALILTYELNDAITNDINLKSVKLEKYGTEDWKPIDFILDFQLKLNLPFDLLSLCESSNEFGILKMLLKIDTVCVQTKHMGTQLQRIVFANRSTIIRDEHRSFVRKTVRKVVSSDQCKRVEKAEFRIEILNAKKLCFRDITMPSLYNFCEDIHLLPVGLEFLNEFLQKPLSFLKIVR